MTTTTIRPELHARAAFRDAVNLHEDMLLRTDSVMTFDLSGRCAIPRPDLSVYQVALWREYYRLLDEGRKLGFL
jgi:hypothetical protein